MQQDRIIASCFVLVLLIKNDLSNVKLAKKTHQASSISKFHIQPLLNTSLAPFFNLSRVMGAAKHVLVSSTASNAPCGLLNATCCAFPRRMRTRLQGVTIACMVRARAFAFRASRFCLKFFVCLSLAVCTYGS